MDPGLKTSTGANGSLLVQARRRLEVLFIKGKKKKQSLLKPVFGCFNPVRTWVKSPRFQVPAATHSPSPPKYFLKSCEFPEFFREAKQEKAQDEEDDEDGSEVQGAAASPTARGHLRRAL